MTADPLIAAARFLQTQLEWLRHATDDQGGPYAVTAYAEIAHCAGRLRGLVNGPAEQKYLGPCGAPLARCPMCDSDDHERREAVDEGDGPMWCDHDWHDQGPIPCTGDIYGTRGASRGRCRTCKAEVAQDDRQAWLDDLARSEAFRASEIHDAYGISADTIRSWARRGKLKSYFRTEGGIVAHWAEPPEGEQRERLHYVGDVLDLAAADAARRAGEQAKRARRKENAA